MVRMTKANHHTRKGGITLVALACLCKPDYLSKRDVFPHRRRGERYDGNPASYSCLHTLGTMLASCFSALMCVTSSPNSY
jgi:hypothetical protein